MNPNNSFTLIFLSLITTSNETHQLHNVKFWRPFSINTNNLDHMTSYMYHSDKDFLWSFKVE